ncbi:hypothetical protein ACFV16_24660 [Streptomyces massasporeus]
MLFSPAWQRRPDRALLRFFSGTGVAAGCASNALGTEVGKEITCD